MTAFALLGVLLVAAALLFVVLPLARQNVRSGESRGSVNVAIYRDQLGELESDLRAGTLAQDQYEKARGEIEARLLEDVRGEQPVAGAPRRSRAAAVVLGLVIPLCAAAV